MKRAVRALSFLYCLSSALPEEVAPAGFEEGNQGNGIGSLRLHIGHFGCMMLVGSYPWVSENKANKISIESRLLFDQ